MWKGDFFLAKHDVVLHPAEGVYSGKAPLQRHIGLADSGKMGGENVDRDFLTRFAAADGRCINWQNVSGINDCWIISKILGGAVIIKETVSLPFHIMQLCIDISG